MVNKPKHITVTGDLGSGKSSICTKLAEKYGASRLSTGGVQRELAAKLGLTTLELNRRADIDPTIDQQIDGIFKTLEDRDEMLIVDSRMAWHFMPHSFKLCMTCDPVVAAQRIWEHQRAGEGYATAEECLIGVTARRDSEHARFFRTYGVRIADHSNYDLVVDTTTRSKDETAEIVFKAYEASLQK